jgi:Poly-gamma-glutamate hydrolase
MNSMEMPKQSTYAAFGSLSPEFEARILKLRLPEQDALKNAPERCSADPVMLESIGRCIGQQVRIRRRDDPRFAALFTAKQANPDVRGRANVIRAGLTGRQRLGSAKEMPAIVQAQVVDPGPQPDGVSFFEVAHDDGKQAYFIAIAPHGGDIEEHTDEQAADAVRELTTAGFQASLWFCKGDGDQAKGAFDRWHITSTDIHPACFPLLQRLMSRTFCYGVAFHGFQRKEDESDVYIGGAASQSLKIVIEGVK